MKIALKYGLLITAVVVLWIVVVRLWLGMGNGPQGQILSAVLFNATAILAIFLGMKERKTAVGGALSFAVYGALRQTFKAVLGHK